MLASDIKFEKHATLKLQETRIAIGSTWNAFFQQKNIKPSTKYLATASDHMLFLGSVSMGTPSRREKKPKAFHKKNLLLTTEHTRLRHTLRNRDTFTFCLLARNSLQMCKKSPGNATT